MKPDKRFILALNRPFGIIKKPFAPAARRLGWKESRLLELVKRYKIEGLIRRFGLILSHRNIGLKSNVLVAWDVPEKYLDRAVRVFVSAGWVSHCYQRKTYPCWPYNIYTMIHGRNRQDCLSKVWLLSRKSGVSRYRALFTQKELKKTKADLWLLTK